MHNAAAYLFGQVFLWCVRLIFTAALVIEFVATHAVWVSPQNRQDVPKNAGGRNRRRCRHGRMADHHSAQLVYGCRLPFQQSSGVLKKSTRCSGSPLDAQFVRGDPKRLSSPHMDTDAWQTIVPREWCMVAGKRSNSLRVC